MKSEKELPMTKQDKKPFLEHGFWWWWDDEEKDWFIGPSPALYSDWKRKKS